MPVTMSHAESGPAPTPAAAGSRLRLLVGLAVLVLLIVLVRALPVDRWLLAFVTWVREAGASGAAVFVAAYVAACVLFLPGSILTLGAGFAYGVAAGTPLVWVAANLGAALAFVLGRTVARDAIAARVTRNPRFAAIDRAVGEQGLRIVLLTRLSPVFPFNLLNYAFGVTRVSFRDYVLGSLIGMLPGTVMYVYLGSLVTSLAELSSGRGGGAAQQAFYFMGLAATVGVTVYVTRVARRALADATGERAATAPHPAGAPAPPAAVTPDDEHNRALLAHAHPRGRVNPTPSGRYNLVVVGAGTAGLVSAAGGAGLGAKVALVERHLMGGDCLNYGCVPSKALLAAGHLAAAARGADAYGVRIRDLGVDFPAVMERMRRLRAGIAPNDGVPRFESLGVDVYLGSARFTGPTTVEVDGRRLEFARAVVATGGRAAQPDVPGLGDVGYLTNETVFSLTALPRRLAVVGGGPIGCELAQAFRRLGADVVLLQRAPRLLPKDDPDASELLARRLRADGVRVVTGAHLVRAARRGSDKVLHYTAGDLAHEVACDEILVGAGRTPNVEGLGLEAAGVRWDRRGIVVDDRLRSTNPRVYAAGDVAARWQYTHAADAMARIVLANALFLGRKKASALTVPWCTYTSPEVAHVGLTARDAEARGVAVDTITVPLHDVDRARLDGAEEGFLRVHVRKGRDTIVGATLVAEHAGETIAELVLAMTAGVGLGTIASTIHPYPTQAEVVKRAADAWNRTRLTPGVKKAFAWWLARTR
jgi:pyruvate/2-oxoglutarate dehydrogenase complex dihydrolipoamide dehydrogenase (E3) component/uncharacterized membrane protein YdjX (TVP38/TMEM64 family)